MLSTAHLTRSVFEVVARRRHGDLVARVPADGFEHRVPDQLDRQPQQLHGGQQREAHPQAQLTAQVRQQPRPLQQ